MVLAKWLGFIDESGAKRPLSGAGSVEDVVSHLAPVQASLQASAAGIARRADLRLDTLSKVRTGASQVRLSRGKKLDWFVELADPAGVGAASGIERKHAVLTGAITPGG